MPHEHGAYLGGVRSVEDLRQRCRIDEDTGCWHWGLCMNQGSPRVWIRIDDSGTRVAMRGRRAALMLARGCDLPQGHMAWGLKHCKSDDCVNPAHCTSGTKRQWGAHIRSLGIARNVPARVRANREIGRRRRLLTDEQAEYIRASEKTHQAVADELGVSRNLVAEIRQRKRYIPLAHGASVFVWRGE